MSPVVANARPFSLGRIYATQGALRALDWAGCLSLVARHAWGDWGDLDEEDRAANDRALLSGARLLSEYNVKIGDETLRVWVITEADRSATTVLLPEEY